MPTTEPILAESIHTTPEALIIYANGTEYTLEWNLCSPQLAKASEEERMQASLSPGGYGIHWPLIDEDLSVSGLINGRADD